MNKTRKTRQRGGGFFPLLLIQMQEKSMKNIDFSYELPTRVKTHKTTLQRIVTKRRKKKALIDFILHVEGKETSSVFT